MGKLSVNHGPEKKGGDDKGGGSGDTPKIDNGGLAAAKAFQDDIAKSLEKQLESSANLADNQDKLNKGQLESSDVGKQIQDSLQARSDAHKKIIKANKAGIIDDKTKQKLVKGINKDSLDQVKNLKSQGKEAAVVEGKLGVMGKALKGMSKMPIIGKGASKALDAMKQKAADGGSKLAVMGAGAKSMATGILGMFGGIGGILKFVLDSIFEVANISRDLQRNMQMSTQEATAYTKELKEHARLTEDRLDSMKDLAAVNQQLNDYRGTAVKMDMDQLTRANALIKTNALTVQQAGEVSKYANIQGKSFEEVYDSQVKGANAMMVQEKISFNMKGIFKDMSNVTNTIKAQLGANPELISAAVVKAKSLGMELNKVAAAGEQLLNFEQSIGAELEAELLTGKQLNLEKARLAALTGDYQTLMQEINNNVGDFGEYTKMNVLQQGALAKAVGMTRDELSGVLMAEADLDALREEALAKDDIKTAKALEAMSVQDEFNNMVFQLKQMFVEEIGPALLPFIEKLTVMLTKGDLLNRMFSSIKTILYVIAAAKFVGLIGGLISLSTVLSAATGMSAGLASALTFGVAAIAIVAGVGMIMGAVKSATSEAGAIADKEISKKKKMAIGGIVLPRAGGTDITVGEGGQAEAIVPLNKSNQMGFGGGGIDYDKMAEAMAKANINVNTNIRHDAFSDYNTIGNEGEYQSKAKYSTNFV